MPSAFPCNLMITQTSLTSASQLVMSQFHNKDTANINTAGYQRCSSLLKSVPLPVPDLAVDVRTSLLGPTVAVLHTEPVVVLPKASATASLPFHLMASPVSHLQVTGFGTQSNYGGFLLVLQFS